MKRMMWGVAVTGVPIAYAGLWFRSPVVWCIGMVLAIPLFIIVLPFCLFLLLAFLTSPLWLPFYKLAAKMHGAPYQSGDWVRILRGPHRNRVVRVYEVWSERNEVRVELGEKEREDVKDVFGYLSVRRVREGE